MKELKQTFCVFILSIVIPGIQNTKKYIIKVEFAFVGYKSDILC